MIEVQFNPADIIKDLQGLSGDLQRKAVRAGLTKASKPFKDTMRSLAPTKTGALRQSINSRQLSARAVGRLGLVLEKKLRPDQVSIIVGPNKRVSGRYVNWIANILEHGADPHEIKPRGESNLSIIGLRNIAKALKLEGGGYSKTASHPGIRARFFMKRAWESGNSQVESLFWVGVQNYLRRRRR